MPWKDRLAAVGQSVHWLDRPAPDDADLSMTLSVARDLGADWLVLDGYHFDPAYQEAVRTTGLRLLVIDDMAHHVKYFADLLVNQNLESERLRYHIPPDTALLLGPRYALLRSEFERWRGWQRPIAPEARRVLVTLGGSDAGDAMAIVTDALQEFPEFEVRIVLGAGHWRCPDAWAVVPREGTRYLRDVRSMAEHMAWADLAISGSGSTAWELAFMGLPSLRR
jgi:spore coat polysaccharide biosynthesis predicted glycosyltransferase SpsG